MKKLAIFDFDGTLFDSVWDVIDCFNEALTRYDFPTLTYDEYIGCLGGNIDEIVSLVLKDNSTPKNIEKVKRTYLELYNPSPKEKTLPFPGAHECLRNLQDKDVLLAVNSNRLDYSLNHFIDRFFVDIDFVLIEGHKEDYPSKPDPYGVNRIMEKANVDLDDAVYIGDSKTDIETAKNAGLDCIIVTWGYGNQGDYENEYNMDTVDEFDDIVKYF